MSLALLQHRIMAVKAFRRRIAARSTYVSRLEVESSWNFAVIPPAQQRQRQNCGRLSRTSAYFEATLVWLPLTTDSRIRTSVYLVWPGRAIQSSEWETSGRNGTPGQTSSRTSCSSQLFRRVREDRTRCIIVKESPTYCTTEKLLWVGVWS